MPMLKTLDLAIVYGNSLSAGRGSYAERASRGGAKRVPGS